MRVTSLARTRSSVYQKKSEAEPSCVSVRSDESLPHPVNFMKTDESRGHPQNLRHEVLNSFRSNLKQTFGRLYEGTEMQRNPTLLNEIYTELYITESESGEISNEHEVGDVGPDEVVLLDFKRLRSTSTP
ncbi:hypothetical protein cypCar_00047672 [Cyprinus carpio]|nr:hypothetical protein cypCar_00047672 [Cyprinus carpio]